MTVSASDIVARRLHEAGVRYAFGIPGGEVVTLIDALDRAGIRFVLTKHENPAGFMAEGVWHIDGAPGVLVATLGPGVANAVNTVANAWQDRVPLIFLTGCVDPVDAADYTHQVFDHGALLRPVTKASLMLVDGAVDTLVDKAVAIALDDRPGPVHLDMPIGLADAAQADAAPVRRVPPSPAAPAPGADLDTARGWLAAAERPLMIAGVDVLNHRAEAAVASFAHDFGVPLITTYKAKGVLPEDDPLALGGAGLSPVADKELLPLIDASDLVVLAGYDPIEMRKGWRTPWPPDKHVVDIAAVANTHYMHQASMNFVGHVGAGLAALGDGVAPRETWADGEPGRARAAIAESFRDDGDWGPAAAIEAVREAMPRDTVAAVDSGAHRILLSHAWPCYAPRGLLQSTALCTMGCALPLAMGVKLAAPERPVVCFTGDAGLEMVLGELATLRDLEMPVVVVVFVDATLSLIDLKQNRMQYPQRGVTFGETDWVALAAAMGGHGIVVESRDATRAGVEAALAADRFTLIAARIDPAAYGRYM